MDSIVKLDESLIRILQLQLTLAAGKQIQHIYVQDFLCFEKL